MRATELADLRAFAAVAELGSFTRAAGWLGVSTPALSQTIRGLEERLGTRLLNRTTRSLGLTAAGGRLLEQVAPLLSGLDRALREASEAGGKVAGELRVCAPPVAIAHLLRPLLPRFRDLHPEVVLDLTGDDDPGDIVARGFDAGVRLGGKIEKDMVAVRLGPDLRKIAVASPAYVARHGRPETPRDLLRHNCVNWRPAGKPQLYRWEFARGGERFEMAVEGSLVVSDCAAAFQAALDGVGVTVWIEQFMGEQLASGRLVPLLEGWSPAFPGFFLYHPSRRRMRPALRAFIDLLRREAPAGARAA